MNRNPVYSPSSYDYLTARREAEALRRKEVSRLAHALSARLRELWVDASTVARLTLDRVRRASAWTFFGAH